MTNDDSNLYPLIEVFDSKGDAMQHSAMRNADGGLGCGYGGLILSEEHLAALRAGKVLVVNVFDEYALLMEIKKSRPEVGG